MSMGTSSNARTRVATVALLLTTACGNDDGNQGATSSNVTAPSAPGSSNGPVVASTAGPSASSPIDTVSGPTGSGVAPTAVVTGPGSSGPGSSGSGSSGSGSSGPVGVVNPQPEPTAGFGGASGGSGGVGSTAAGGSAGVSTGAAGKGGGGGAGGVGPVGPRVWSCPPGVAGTPMLDGTPTRIASVPPADDFNLNNGTFGIVEGPVWTGSELYVSELSNESYEPQSADMKKARLLRVTPDGQTSVVVADSGTNGLALDADGTLVAANHRDGTLERLSLPGGAATPLVGNYMGVRLNSPNDVAIHSSGTIYFSDPSYNAPTPPPQDATRVYRVVDGATAAEPIPSSDTPDSFDAPNGVTLSLAEDYLYVAATVGRRYPVMADGTVGPGENWAAANGGDGMVIDCAGNLYVALATTPNIAVFTPDGSSIGMITIGDVQAVTNLAFGGDDRQTLYITAYGSSKGLFELPLNLPGRPY